MSLFSAFFTIIMGCALLRGQPADTIYFEKTNKIRAYGWMQDNEKDSIWVFYYPEGGIEKTGLLEKGLPKGSWTYFLPDGRISHTIEYKNGQISSQTHFLQKNGNLKIAPVLTDTIH